MTIFTVCSRVNELMISSKIRSFALHEVQLTSHNKTVKIEGLLLTIKPYNEMMLGCLNCPITDASARKS